MNKLWFLPLVLVVGCASKPQIVEVEVPSKPKIVEVPQTAWLPPPPSTNPVVVTGFKDVEYMQRNEVIQATKDCVDNHLKPVIQYVPQKTAHGTLMLPAMVNCEVVQGYTIPDVKQNDKQEIVVVKTIRKEYDHQEFIKSLKNQPGVN